MARTTFQLAYDCSFDEAKNKIEAILKNKKFHEVILKTGENVWKNGTGMLTAMKFIKVEYSENSIKLSAWVQIGMGSVGGGEMDLAGVVAAIPKKQLMKVIEEIKAVF